MNETDIKLVL